MTVMSINLSSSIAVTEDGSMIPVTNLLNSDGEECSPSNAVAAVAGPDCWGFWHTLTLSDYEKVTQQ